MQSVSTTAVGELDSLYHLDLPMMYVRRLDIRNNYISHHYAHRIMVAYKDELKLKERIDLEIGGNQVSNSGIIINSSNVERQQHATTVTGHRRSQGERCRQ